MDSLFDHDIFHPSKGVISKGVDGLHQSGHIQQQFELLSSHLDAAAGGAGH